MNVITENIYMSWRAGEVVVSPLRRLVHRNAAESQVKYSITTVI